jgi:hypothetical protein
MESKSASRRSFEGQIARLEQGWSSELPASRSVPIKMMRRWRLDAEVAALYLSRRNGLSEGRLRPPSTPIKCAVTLLDRSQGVPRRMVPLGFASLDHAIKNLITYSATTIKRRIWTSVRHQTYLIWWSGLKRSDHRVFPAFDDWEPLSSRR